MNRTYLAADFGGGSGRIIAGQIEDSPKGKRLVTNEVCRFGNRVVNIGEYLYWDFPALFADLKEGLAKAAGIYSDIVSIGVDTWGVDFGLVDDLGNLIGNPICYRDNHTSEMPREFSKCHDVAQLYRQTGIQMLSINTLFRLLSMVKTGDPKLKIAESLLFMPDLLSYYLTGVKGNEYTIASTSELLDATSKDWNFELIKSIGININLFGKILMPGETRGTLLDHVSKETGLSTNVRVVAVPSHDTASAVFAADADYETDACAFLSSGTWSLLGVTLKDPILTEEARLADFTNEGGADNKICFLTNITGLWILQCLKSQWDNEKPGITWDILINEARKSEFTGIIDVDNPMFQEPGDMKHRIVDYCHKEGLKTPVTRGEFVKCICLSLAHRYAKAIRGLDTLLPHPIKKLKIFGGGAKNNYLNELTADATGLEVIAWPVEATAFGNLISQAIADNAIKNRKEIIEIIEK